MVRLALTWCNVLDMPLVFNDVILLNCGGNTYPWLYGDEGPTVFAGPDEKHGKISVFDHDTVGVGDSSQGDASGGKPFELEGTVTEQIVTEPENVFALEKRACSREIRQTGVSARAGNGDGFGMFKL